jgi:hypothetical protein
MQQVQGKGGAPQKCTDRNLASERQRQQAHTCKLLKERKSAPATKLAFQLSLWDQSCS